MVENGREVTIKYSVGWPSILRIVYIVIIQSDIGMVWWSIVWYDLVWYMAVFPNLFCLMYCHGRKVLTSVNFTHIILFPFHKKMCKTITLFINSYFNVLSKIKIFPSALWNRLRYLWLGITGICLVFYGRQKQMIYRFIPLIRNRFLPCISGLVKR